MFNYLDPVAGVIVLANALIFLIVLFGRSDKTIWRTSISITCLTAVVSYLSWRTWYVWLAFSDKSLNSTELTLSALLLLFEYINFGDFAIFLLTMSRFSDRKKQADEAEAYLRSLSTEELPHVDVFVATYNEEWSILEKTILAIQHLDYPHVHGYLLDDGKRDWLKAKCEEVGFGYIRRPGNANKKPGNHNYGLSQTTSPFIAVFDADFIPMPHFLTRTLGLLLKNPNWGILQTPQVFYNCDPMRNNLKLQMALPDDTAMFFTVMEPCRDAWNCAFYVGSSAILRREAVEKIGGIVMGYDTEDQITSIAMLQHGYQTGFLNEALSTGLAPESLSAMFAQRKRWARGSIQILFSKHGPLGPNLSFLQRLMFSQTFWLIGFIAPLVYAFIPPFMWIFQLRLFPYMPPAEVFFIPLFLFVAINMSIWWLSRGLWYPVVSAALQLILSFEVLPTILTTLAKPFGKPLLSFSHVTPKGQSITQEPLINWSTMYWLVGILVATLFGICLYLLDDYQFINHVDELKAAALWTLINLAVVVVAILGSINLTYQRTSERFPVVWPVTLQFPQQLIPTQTINISLTGILVRYPLKIAPPEICQINLPGVGNINCQLVRHEENQVAYKYEPLSDLTHQKLFKALFLNPKHHQTKLEGPVSLYWRCMQRFFHPS